MRPLAHAAPFIVASGLLSAAAPPRPQEIAAAARFSPRPEVCSDAEAFWLRTQEPALAQGCVALARAYSLLRREPAVATKVVDVAAQLSELAPHVQLLRARAALRNGRFRRALAGFRQLGVQNGAGLRDAATLHDFALAAVGAGEYALGLGAYRVLLPRASLLSADPGRALRVSAEAAMAAQRLGPSYLGEALGYLTPAIRQATPVRGDIETYLHAMQELVWQRQGTNSTPQADATERALRLTASLPNWARAEGRAKSKARAPSKPAETQLRPERWLPFLLAHEYWALVAVQSQYTSADISFDAWQRYLSLAPEGDPWRAHAHAQLADLAARSGSL